MRSRRSRARLITRPTPGLVLRGTPNPVLRFLPGLVLRRSTTLVGIALRLRRVGRRALVRRCRRVLRGGRPVGALRARQRSRPLRRCMLGTTRRDYSVTGEHSGSRSSCDRGMTAIDGGTERRVATCELLLLTLNRTQPEVALVLRGQFRCSG